jgi:DNA-binding GntR family transcriptional regulator
MLHDVVLRKVQPVPLRTQIALALREAILSGKLRPGDKVVERRVALQLGVSQAAVREALSELEHEGLIAKRPNIGSFVIELSCERIRESLRVRLQLEPYAMLLASQRLVPRTIHELQALVDRFDDATKAGDAHRLALSDFAFHERIWELAGNDVLLRVLTQVCKPIFAFVSIVLSSSHAPLRTDDIHQRILDAMVEGDPAGIERIGHLQIEHTWAPYLREDGDPGNGGTPLPSLQGETTQED